MLIKVQNLGTLQSAETDLSKDLIVFCGGNNSGKTYMLNFLYGILESSWEYPNYNSNEYFKDIINELIVNKTAVFDFNFVLDDEKFNSFLSFWKMQTLKSLPSYFGIKKLFKDFDFHFERENNSFIPTYFYDNYSIQESWENNLQLRLDLISKTENEDDLSTELSRIFYSAVRQQFDTHNNIKFFTSERASTSIFAKHIANNTLKKSFMGQNTDLSQYPNSIQEEIYFFNNLSSFEDFYSYLADDLEEIIKGKMKVNKYGDAEFVPNQERGKVYPIEQGSSIVRSLSSFIFYFRYVNLKCGCIIIDEPELSLHPDNQRKFARFLCRCVNEGFKVIISTHSDYIISEINNLITLHNHKEQASSKKIMKKYGYQENQTLDYQRVAAYLFKERKNELIPMSQQGFSVETIDTEIDKLADASDDIANNFDKFKF